MYGLGDSDNYSLADYASTKCGNRFKVFGKGTVSVKPDVAEAVIGVITENAQLEVAQEENAKATQQVINSIMEIGVLPKYIQTQNYNIRPIQINEQDKGTITPLTVTALKSVSGATPIEAGENKITADIEAVFIYTE